MEVARRVIKGDGAVTRCLSLPLSCVGHASRHSYYIQNSKTGRQIRILSLGRRNNNFLKKECNTVWLAIV